MVRKFDRLFGRIQYTNYLLNDKTLSKYLSGIALCELATHSGVPMIQELCIKLLNFSKLARPSKLAIDREGFLLTKEKPVIKPISYDTRLSFERAFNISPQEQINFEKSLNSELSIDIIEFLNKYSNFKITEFRDI